MKYTYKVPGLGSSGDIDRIGVNCMLCRKKREVVGFKEVGGGPFAFFISDETGCCMSNFKGKCQFREASPKYI